MKVTTAKWLRIGAVLAFFEGLAHTALFLTYVPSHGPEEAAVVAAMRSHLFRFGGALHSYWDFYTGYGLFVTAGVLIEGFLLWEMAALATRNAKQLRGICVVFVCGEAAYAGLIWKFFSFPIPLTTHILIAVCVFSALISARQ
jgi:hypothetical protein